MNFIPLAKPCIEEQDLLNATETLKSGWWTTGPKVAEFEKAFCKYINKDEELYCVGLNSCTSALHLSLLALDIKEGDEVIVPTWTFAATIQIVEWVGAVPILCDVLEDSLTIDPQKCEKLITEKTKAVIPVHIAGFPYEIDEIEKLAKKHNLRIIEDAAHGAGSSYNGERIGNHGDISCFSFYATKNLAMGEGGAAVSKDPELIEKIRKLSYFGINKEAFKRYEKSGTWRYDIEGLGYKCNLDSVHASIGLSQLERLDSMNERRRAIAKKYREKLENVDFLKDDNKHYHTYHLFPILLPKKIERDDFIQKLKENNIGTSVHFIPLHLHSFYRDKFDSSNYPIANKVFNNIVSIPMYPTLTEDEVEYVINTINKITK